MISFERAKIILMLVRWRGTPNCKSLGVTFPKPHTLSTLGLLPVQMLWPAVHRPFGGSCYVCRDWVSQVSMKKLKLIARQYRLREEIHQPSPTDRPHFPPPSFMAFSEAIMRGGGSLPLHPFIEAVLQYFNVAPFKFTLNSFYIIMAFFIVFTEACLVEPIVNEFAYIFGIKALMKHKGFWYTTRQGLDVKGIVGLCSNIGQLKG